MNSTTGTKQGSINVAAVKRPDFRVSAKDMQNFCKIAVIVSGIMGCAVAYKHYTNVPAKNTADQKAARKIQATHTMLANAYYALKSKGVEAQTVAELVNNPKVPNPTTGMSWLVDATPEIINSVILTPAIPGTTRGLVQDLGQNKESVCQEIKAAAAPEGKKGVGIACVKDGDTFKVITTLQ